MKHSILLSSALLFGVSAAAQTSVTVSIGGGASIAQKYYSLSEGERVSVPLAEWDLAFEIAGLTSSIQVNTSKGLEVWETNVAFEDWESFTEFDAENIDTNWTVLDNSPTSWSKGALTHGNNLEEEDGRYMGWGGYNQLTHFVTGDKIYVIKDGTGAYKKFRVDHLISGTYTFTYSDIDGANEQTGTVVKSQYAGKNFGYFSFATGTALDLEPLAAEWDLLFTRYKDYAPTIYPVVGVLQNKAVSVLQVDSVELDQATWWGEEFSSEINTIGYDWKRLNAQFAYEYNTLRTYFVQDRSGGIWKLHFTGYVGGTTGSMTFTQEQVSAASVENAGASTELVLFPNPVVNGQVNLLLDRNVINGQLSIVDMSGKLVREQLVNGTGSLSQVSVDVNGLGRGMYLVQLRSEGLMFNGRLVVE